MGRIQQLDAQTANMIAAGEVVERPRGVVKELIENAIDAGSTQIVISTVKGGCEKLTVRDNGCGMDAVDATACFGRHATSKIHSQNDLWNIHTMGFRGEALPSIASVSKVTLVTSNGDDCTRVVMEYGQLVKAEPYPCDQGTEISVEGLFYRTPARLKHLRSAAYETSLIQDLVMRFAMGHPDISFVMQSDGRETFRTSGDGSLQEVLFQCWGREPTENALELKASDYDYTITGYIIRPTVTRASRNFMQIFLNGRMVHTFRLYSAVQEGYGGYLPADRYPMAVLNVEMDPHLVDVNVHPSKWEVRLSKENQLEYLLQDSVRETLEKSHPARFAHGERAARMPSYYAQTAMDLNGGDAGKDQERTVLEKPSVIPQGGACIEEMQINEPPTVTSSYSTGEPVKDTVEAAEDVPVSSSQLSLDGYSGMEHSAVPAVSEESSGEEEESALPEIVLLGQLQDHWLIGTCEKGIVLIDPRRAQARILFEQAQQRLRAPGTMMELLVPATVQCGDAVVQRLEDLNAFSRNMGIVFEAFGHDTLRIRQVPSWMKDMNIAQTGMDLVEAFQEEKRSGSDVVQRLARQMAYGGAMSSVRRLSMAEMKELLRQLGECRNPWNDPSGKPVLVILDAKDVAREFGS